MQVRRHGVRSMSTPGQGFALNSKPFLADASAPSDLLQPAHDTSTVVPQWRCVPRLWPQRLPLSMMQEFWNPGCSHFVTIGVSGFSGLATGTQSKVLDSSHIGWRISTMERQVQHRNDHAW